MVLYFFIFPIFNFFFPGHLLRRDQNEVKNIYLCRILKGRQFISYIAMYIKYFLMLGGGEIYRSIFLMCFNVELENLINFHIFIFKGIELEKAWLIHIGP